MDEVRSLLKTYQKQRQASEPLVLATVLRVQGSSYRQPGTRMLINTKGEISGSVSGGCLERDLIQQARFAVGSHSRFKIIRYDTTDEGDEFESLRSVSLGCQGIVDIGLEYLPPGETHPVLELIQESIEQSREGRVATVISGAENYKNDSLSGRVFALSVGALTGAIDCLASIEFLEGIDKLNIEVVKDLKNLTSNQVKVYETSLGEITILLEIIRPPKRWIIFGAGHDSIPLAETAKGIGWHVTVVDCRSSYSMTQRFFSKVDVLLRCEPSQISSKLNLTSDTLCVLATHNYYHDREILKQLLDSSVNYIGILGPKEKGLSLLDDFKKDGIKLNAAALSKIYSPVGIDSGAESPQEIALSIITEAMSVTQGRTAGFLKDRDGPIHDRSLLG
jgi:xanthine dehydrogenase accessory factor